MTVRERVLLCRLIEKIEKNKEHAEKMGIINDSTFKGKKCFTTSSGKKD